MLGRTSRLDVLYVLGGVTGVYIYIEDILEFTTHLTSHATFQTLGCYTLTNHFRELPSLFIDKTTLWFFDLLDANPGTCHQTTDVLQICIPPKKVPVPPTLFVSWGRKSPGNVV